jgi:hypothetical protein
LPILNYASLNTGTFIFMIKFPLTIKALALGSLLIITPFSAISDPLTTQEHKHKHKLELERQKLERQEQEIIQQLLVAGGTKVPPP